MQKKADAAEMKIFYTMKRAFIVLKDGYTVFLAIISKTGYPHNDQWQEVITAPTKYLKV